MLFAGARLAPWLLLRIVHTRSRELFILTVVALALGTAVGSTELFGVSLALGAFLAGVVLSESSLSHKIGDEVLPFRETFAVLFFVSVGMLVNLTYLFANADHVLVLTVLIVVGKSVMTALLGMLFPIPARTALVVAATGVRSASSPLSLARRACDWVHWPRSNTRSSWRARCCRSWSTH